MSFRPRIGVEVVARPIVALALLWLACGEVPQGAAGGLRREIITSQALQATSGGSSGLTGALANARSFHTATLLPSGKVLVTGGWNSGGDLASAEVYDPGTGAWSPTGALANARSFHTATLLPSGKVLVTGGEGSGGDLASAEVYDLGTGAWNPTGALANARRDHTATLLPSGKVLVTGGWNSGGDLASAEVYDPG
ncbi:MAG TPA: kelch repeat-containing protein, partial [Archangium sp.]